MDRRLEINGSNCVTWIWTCQAIHLHLDFKWHITKIHKYVPLSQHFKGKIHFNLVSYNSNNICMDIWCGCQKRSRQLQLLVRRRASWVLEQVVSFIELGLMLQIWMLQLVPLTSAAAQHKHTGGVCLCSFIRVWFKRVQCGYWNLWINKSFFLATDPQIKSCIWPAVWRWIRNPFRLIGKNVVLMLFLTVLSFAKMKCTSYNDTPHPTHAATWWEEIGG